MKVNHIDTTLSQSLFLNIINDVDVVEKINNEVCKNLKAFEKYVVMGINKNWNRALKKNAFFKLCLTYAYLPITYKKYKELGIPDSVFFDTFSDIKIWVDDHYEETKSIGLAEFNWIHNHLNLEIFKLGRLQFHLTKYFHPSTYKNNNVEIKFGDFVLNLHIPRGGKLDTNLCQQSFALAKDFFPKYFPKYPTTHAICHSWLLHQSANLYMKSDSNIIKFKSLFDVIKEYNTPSQAFKWLFNIKLTNIKAIRNKKKMGKYYIFPTHTVNTPLQNSAIAYIENGGTLGEAFGIVKL